MKIYLFTFISFFLFNVNSFAQVSSELLEIQEIRITTKVEKWQYLLDSLRINGDGTLAAEITIDGKTYDKAAFRYKASRGFTPNAKRNPLFLQLDKAHQNHTEIHLSDALRDPSMLREVLAYHIIGKYMPAPKAQFAKIYVNNQFYALLVNIAPKDDYFFQKFYKSDQGNLFVSEPQLGVKASAACKQNNFAALQYDESIICYQDQFVADGAWNELRNLAKTLNENPEKVDRILAVDEVLWMLAANNVLVNLDSYTGRGSQNYSLYQDKNGIFHPLHGEMNLAFGSYKNTGEGSDLEVEELVKLDPMLHLYSSEKPLINQLLSNERNRKIYISHMRTILEDFFWNGKFEDITMSLYKKITPILSENNYDLSRFNESLISTTGERSKIPGLIAFMKKRANFLKKHPILTVLPSNIGTINLKTRAQFSSQQVDAFEFQVAIDRFPKEVALYYRFQDSEIFKKAIMTDDGGEGDETANDNIYGTKVMPKGSMIEYYIFVENSGAVTFEPSDYLFTRKEASLIELNK